MAGRDTSVTAITVPDISAGSSWFITVRTVCTELVSSPCAPLMRRLDRIDCVFHSSNSRLHGHKWDRRCTPSWSGDHHPLLGSLYGAGDPAGRDTEPSAGADQLAIPSEYAGRFAGERATADAANSGRTRADGIARATLSVPDAKGQRPAREKPANTSSAPQRVAGGRATGRRTKVAGPSGAATCYKQRHDDSCRHDSPIAGRPQRDAVGGDAGRIMDPHGWRGHQPGDAAAAKRGPPERAAG
jgi:hypothetical protein